MAEKGGTVGCAEEQRQHVGGPENPEIAVPGGRLTEVAHPVGPHRSTGDDERRGVAGVQDPAGRGRRVVPGDSDDGSAGQVEERRKAGVDRLERIALGVRLLAVPGFVRRLGVHVDERCALAEQLDPGGNAVGHLPGQVVD
jgi:hypothetical protein